MERMLTIALMFLAAFVYATPMSWAQKDDDQEHAELAKALKEAKIPLQRGLTASSKQGKPISAKYELEGGHLQLSIYTTKGYQFSEVIVDHKTGKVLKAEPITGGEDLEAAKAQREAMATAKRSLEAAAAAVNENKGFQAVSVTPAIKEGHPVADVTLVKGAEWKTVFEKLD